MTQRSFAAQDLTVVIPTHGRPDILQRTLGGLAQQSADGFEVVVVVDGTDQPVPSESWYQTIVQDHAGPGVARNRGVRASERPLVLFLGDDMIPTPTLVEHHLRRHNESPSEQVAVLGHVDWHPEARGGRILRWLDWSGTQFDFGSDEDGVAGFGRFISSNVSLKRSLFLDAGGFDEEFSYYYEDLEFAFRLHERGMVLLYEPRALAQHHHSYDLATVRRRFEGIAEGEWQLARKRPEFSPFFLDRVRTAVGRPEASPWWPLLVDAVPRRFSRLRRRGEDRANAWYYQHVSSGFLNSWHAQEDLDDLRAYLADRYDEALLHGHVAAVDREEHESADEATFYRTSEMYLYDLTAFALAGTKVPYRRDLRRLVPPGTRLLDWGCGIGTDGIRLIDDGYPVSFADFDNPSTAYLRWRLNRRGIDAAVYDVEADAIPGDFGLAYSFDVIEHVEDPFSFLGELERRADLVMVNFLEPDPDDTHLHRPLPIRALLRYASQRGLLHYRIYHGRSHLVVYRSGGATRRERLRGAFERRARPAAHRLELRLRS